MASQKSRLGIRLTPSRVMHIKPTVGINPSDGNARLPWVFEGDRLTPMVVGARPRYGPDGQKCPGGVTRRTGSVVSDPDGREGGSARRVTHGEPQEWVTGRSRGRGARSELLRARTESWIEDDDAGSPSAVDACLFMETARWPRPTSVPEYAWQGRISDVF